jgi:translation initiation factor 2B subunit (eIF-2B alpha/beta/delta family)
MTPKEKAIELVDMFMEHTVEWDNVKEVAFDSEYHAKKCALIAVEKEYNSLRELLFNLKSCRVIESELTYLKRINDLIQEEQQVKQEIEKL